MLTADESAEDPPLRRLPGLVGRWRSVAAPRPHFPPAQEARFRHDYNLEGRTYRTEMWLGLAAGLGLLLIFHSYFLPYTGGQAFFTPILAVALVVPMVLRGLAGRSTRLASWSTALFIASVYLDIGCLMWLRLAGQHAGQEVIPVIVPTAVLITMFGVQISFDIAAPAMLGGLAGIAAVELTGLPQDSNGLFNLLASAALVLVALGTSYELESSARSAWARRRELHRLARTDTLTGLPNRRALVELLEKPAADPSPTAPVAAILDIDDFKTFNDTFGHPAGDRCLERIGAYLAETLDEGEFAARLGGEEFVVLWPGTDTGAALARAEFLRAGIGTEVSAPDGRPVTMSAGCAVPAGQSSGGTAPAALLARADAALYAAKAAGRNRLAVEPITDARPVPGGRHAGLPRGDGTGAAAADRLHLVTGPATLRFADPAREAGFRESFEAQGRTSRALIMGGLIVVCVVILIIQKPVLKIPEEADLIGRLTLLLGLIPAAAAALATTLVPRWRRYSLAVYVAAVAIILFAQMAQRVVQLPKGFDVVPFLMPVAILLSLTVARIRYSVLVPAISTLVSAVCLTELVAFPLDGLRVLNVATTVFITAGATRFAYRLEYSRRVHWFEARLLESLTRIDPLTGLLNRRAFTAALDDALTGDRGAVGLALIDLDHFKAYNDGFGHLAGDECLRTTGTALVEAARREDAALARLGGEEFAVVLTGGTAAELAERAERIRAAVGALALPGPDPDATVTASAGFAYTLGGDCDGGGGSLAAALLSTADTALYAAKVAGRDRLAQPPEHVRSGGSRTPRDHRRGSRDQML